MLEGDVHWVEPGSNPVEVPKRIATIPPRVPARFQEERTAEKLVMSFPHLIIREVICFLLVVVVMGLLALLVDAPLEELADTQHTPNPAKAPWYFLGLQELLHFFPPLVAGVFIPALVVVALIVIPYFKMNVRREGLWIRRRKRTFVLLSMVVALIAFTSGWFHAFDIAIPTLLLYAAAAIPYASRRLNGWVGWLRQRSMADWVMAWFVVLATVLTVVGTFFRGPGWSLVWPWKTGAP